MFLCFINKNGWKLIFRWSRSQTLFVINNDVLQTMNNVNTNIHLNAEKLDYHREDSSMFEYTLRSHLCNPGAQGYKLPRLCPQSHNLNTPG